MKFKASSLFLALLVCSAASVSAERQLFRSVTNDYAVEAGHVRSFTCDVCIEDIPKSPKWTDSDAQPPLPARRAMRIAQDTSRTSSAAACLVTQESSRRLRIP